MKSFGSNVGIIVLMLSCSYWFIGGVFAMEKSAQQQIMSDPYQWLEAIEDEKVLNWVREQNKVTEQALTQTPHFKQLKADLLTIYNSKERIPFISKLGTFYYNFWQDDEHPQGVWRRTSLEEYRKANPKWETVLDLDALSKAEQVTWVWGGSDCLPPDYKRCLIDLSKGGADATTTREFDLEQKRFVDNGFIRPEAKGLLAWKDADTVYVASDFGANSLTESGYPRVVREWKRGTPMTEASLVYEGSSKDLGVGAYRNHQPDFERDIVYHNLSFYEDDVYIREADGKLVKLDAPKDSHKYIQRSWLLLQLRSAYTYQQQSYSVGSLIATPLADFMAGKAHFQVLFTPTTHSSLENITFTRDYVILTVLEDVKNHLRAFKAENTQWQEQDFGVAPNLGTVSLEAVDPDYSNDYFMTVTDYLTPSSLYQGAVGKAPEKLKQTPSFFETNDLAISQHFATSKDGTRVPYFQIAPKNLVLNATHPTLLYGYGGFEVSLTPVYDATVGKAWLNQGGIYVVANIRGGGEYGPAWHQAAVKEKRYKAYEDFAAIAQDLIARKVTNPKKLGIIGASNGGLLMGNMLIHYPELFGAIVSEVPLLDMQRYPLLLAGASWLDEYGNPETDWSQLHAYSPYHHVKAEQKYPPLFLKTSTRDDRVHPAHARKMFAKMKDQGHAVWYYENIEGGHEGAANKEQAALMEALSYEFLYQHLMSQP
ncbi:prolyl oligopeptidase family serine peptidase [Thiolinea disciformis]|uniref:prolyl oligopeptidase family serine peptidase n=1 Tax=Thiolinea disciformis TaxID=125614 RepID=UPI00037095D9|nr:prolyl oligopeptidase family serine peptidase [Thiolinea disciformis]